MPHGTDDRTVVDRLAGTHVLITGVTGFVGEALLHRLLSVSPAATLTVLVRSRGTNRGADRVRTLLRKPVFAAIVEAAGGADELLATRVRVLEGDMAALPALPDDLDAVVHCAGDVSFDAPVDQAFATNVVGPRDLLTRIGELDRPDGVHYVHVSTAYVAGRRRGTIPEGPVEHDVDVDAELAWGLAQRGSVEARSRDADLLAGFRRRAERDHRRAGLLTAAEAVEERRRAWVDEELVRLGVERARSLGWTDAYTFTKALGERVVEAAADRLAVSIVRPSIIESALAVPHPGWIEGMKVAEPLILAFGRGELPESPAAEDTTIDIIPVDQVVSAVVAVLAHPPQAGRPNYFHLTSGARNPMSFGDFYRHIRAYFAAHPFEPGDRGTTPLPDWRFPGARSVERALTTSERAYRVADRMISWAPRGERSRELAGRLDTQGRRLTNLRRYLDLYSEYVQADLRFDDAATHALFTALGPADQQLLAFDPAVIDWRHYVEDVHCPAVTATVRRLDANRRRRGATTSTPTLRAAAASQNRRAAAFFDLDGTLLSSNVVETYLWSRLQELSGTQRWAELGRVAVQVPRLVKAERHERDAFLRAMYRNYRGARLGDLERVVDDTLTDYVLSRVVPAAIRRIREHRAAGQPTVLVTAAIRPLTRPLAPLFDHVEAADLDVDAAGVCTGELAHSAMVGEARAAWVRAWAGAHDVDLTASFAYADSYSDLPLLDAVGRPAAVSPDIALYRHARRKHWPVVDWTSPAGARRLDPARGPR